MKQTASPSLSGPHALLALAIVLVWGTNFTIAKLALGQLPPVFFTALRFFFVVFPALFFLRRPAVPWRLLAAYGLLTGAGQFGFLMRERIAMFLDGRQFGGAEDAIPCDQCAL